MNSINGAAPQQTTRATGRGYRSPTPQDTKRQQDRGFGMKALKGLSFAASTPIRLIARGIGEGKDLASGRNDHQGSFSDYMSNSWDSFKFRWE